MGHNRVKETHGSLLGHHTVMQQENNVLQNHPPTYPPPTNLPTYLLAVNT